VEGGRSPSVDENVSSDGIDGKKWWNGFLLGLESVSVRFCMRF
jgi:hypothetical protein